MTKSFEHPSPDNKKASDEIEARLKNVKALEKAGARVLFDSEKKDNRKELHEKLAEIQRVANEKFEEFGYADKAIDEALIDLGYLK